jgi:hypothetical protein
MCTKVILKQQHYVDNIYFWKNSVVCTISVTIFEFNKSGILLSEHFYSASFFRELWILFL